MKSKSVECRTQKQVDAVLLLPEHHVTEIHLYGDFNVAVSGLRQLRIVARDSSQPRIEARDYAQVSVNGHATGTAGPCVAVLIDGDAEIVGGRQVRVGEPIPDTGTPPPAKRKIRAAV